MFADNKIDDIDIQSIAENLTDWQAVAKKLRFGPVVIQKIEDKNREINQAKAFLRKWIARDGSGATYKKLHDVLMELKNQGSAEAILGIAKERYVRCIVFFFFGNEFYTTHYFFVGQSASNFSKQYLFDSQPQREKRGIVHRKRT